MEGRSNCPYLCPPKEAILHCCLSCDSTVVTNSHSHHVWKHQGPTEPASDFFRVSKHPQWLMVQLHWTALSRGEHQHADCAAERELHPTLSHHPSHQHQDHRQLDQHDGAQEGAGRLAQVSGSFPWRRKQRKCSILDGWWWLCLIPDNMKLKSGPSWSPLYYAEITWSECKAVLVGKFVIPVLLEWPANDSGGEKADGLRASTKPQAPNIFHLFKKLKNTCMSSY